MIRFNMSAANVLVWWYIVFAGIEKSMNLHTECTQIINIYHTPAACIPNGLKLSRCHTQYNSQGPNNNVVAIKFVGITVN